MINIQVALLAQATQHNNVFKSDIHNFFQVRAKAITERLERIFVRNQLKKPEQNLNKAILVKSIQTKNAEEVILSSQRASGQ